MIPDALLLGSRRVHPSGVDIAVCLVGIFFVVGAQFRLIGQSDISGTLIFGLPSAAVVLVRRRWPVPVLLAVFVILAAGWVAGQHNEALLVFPLIALFTLANQTDRRTTVVAGVITGTLLYLGVLLQPGIGWDQGNSVAAIAWTATFAAVGDATRNRRSYVEAVEERARKAESERDSEAARQVAEERLRIARELHDVLAHHIAVIHVHAALADATMSTVPDTSKESLGYIRQAAADVLSELSALIPVLRGTEDSTADTAADGTVGNIVGHTAGSTADGTAGSTDARREDSMNPAPPAPGLNRLDDLIDSHRRSGSPVRVSVTGRPRKLSSAADLAAYRIIQEALTNAAKHGVPGSAELGISYTDEYFAVRATNRVDPDGRANVPGTGHGLVGMRERAASVGAELTTGARRDVFTVELQLAVSERVQ